MIIGTQILLFCDYCIVNHRVVKLVINFRYLGLAFRARVLRGRPRGILDGLKLQATAGHKMSSLQYELIVLWVCVDQ
jgi:hypothetical protein